MWEGRDAEGHVNVKMGLFGEWAAPLIVMYYWVATKHLH